MIEGFSNWERWKDRNGLTGMKFPGVYAIAISETDMAGKPFGWCAKIVYVGMTNAQGGLKSRLQQLSNTLQKKDASHGGGERVLYKYPDYQRLAPRLFVSIWPRECDVKLSKPNDLRAMGEIARLEYECFAVYVEKFDQLPEFNDKKLSPKG